MYNELDGINHDKKNRILEKSNGNISVMPFAC